MKDTTQQQFWTSQFGADYTERNIYSPDELDVFYRKTFGVTATAMIEAVSRDLNINNVLEVGRNVGNQLRLLQKLGFQNLTGVEIQPYAVERAKQLTHDIDIVEGSAFELPFPDDFFDLVFTAGVLIHVAPADLPTAMTEIHRVSRRYIRGLEYWSGTHQEIEYRGNKNRLWKGDFADMYSRLFFDLKLLKRKKFKYLENENIDEMFLLEKVK